MKHEVPIRVEIYRKTGPNTEVRVETFLENDVDADEETWADILLKHGRPSGLYTIRGTTSRGEIIDLGCVAISGEEQREARALHTLSREFPNLSTDELRAYTRVEYLSAFAPRAVDPCVIDDVKNAVRALQKALSLARSTHAAAAHERGEIRSQLQNAQTALGPARLAAADGSVAMAIDALLREASATAPRADAPTHLTPVERAALVCAESHIAGSKFSDLYGASVLIKRLLVELSEARIRREKENKDNS